MFIEERHKLILDYLNSHGRISANEMQDLFKVSFDTARRDLRILEGNGLLKRTHGGALPLRQVGLSPKPKGWTAHDMSEINDNYLAIAMKAISMIKKNDVIYITTASVGYIIAQNLPTDIHITVVTNSIINAEELRKHNNITCIIAGGIVDDKGYCRDSFAIECIKKLRFDIAFITSSCISADFGLSIQTTNLGVIKAVLESSKRIVGLFPTEKIGFESIVQICPVKDLDVLVVDWDAPEEELKKFDELGVEVVIVEKED